VPEQGWHGEELQAACRPSPPALLTALAYSCCVLANTLPHKNLQLQYVWWHICQGGPGCEWLNGVEDGSFVCQQLQWPGDATCHVAQQAGPLYLDSPHCQGGGLSRLQRARTAGLVGCYSVACCTSTTPAAMPGSEDGEDSCLPSHMAANLRP
jgi:hypothetical protein